MQRLLWIALVGIIFAATPSFAEKHGQTTTLRGYAEILKALQSGLSVRFAIDYNKCSPPLGPADAAGGVDTFEWFNLPSFGIEESVAWSQTELITNYQGSGYAWDYVRMVAFPNDTLIVTASDLNTTTYAPIYEETTYCPINSAAIFSADEKELPLIQLFDYDSIHTALGKSEVRVFQNYTSCPVYVGPFGKPGLNVTAGSVITTIENFRGGRFTDEPFFGYSLNQLIKNYDGPGYQRDLVEAKVFRNGSVILNVHVFDVLTYQSAFSEYFECFIDNFTTSGFKFFIPFTPPKAASKTAV